MDLRTALTEAMEKHSVDAGKPTDTPIEKPVEAAEKPVDKPIEAKPTDKPIEKPRDEQGKFAKPTEKPPETEYTRKAPSSWKPDAQMVWTKADKGEALTNEELRLLIGETERREGDFLKGAQEFKSHADRARAYDQAISPYQAHLQSLGVDAPTAIASLLNTDVRLRTADPATKRAMVEELARYYGVDLAAEAPQYDPQMVNLMREITTLREQQKAWENNARTQQMSSAQNELNKFAEGKPHFEAVREDMATLLISGRAASLNDAYDMAVWMRPDIRSTLIEQQRADERKQAEEAARAARAKTAAVSVKGSTPNAGNQPSGTSLREIIAAQFAES
jgi:hypothetical protein